MSEQPCRNGPPTPRPARVAELAGRAAQRQPLFPAGERPQMDPPKRKRGRPRKTPAVTAPGADPAPPPAPKPQKDIGGSYESRPNGSSYSGNMADELARCARNVCRVLIDGRLRTVAELRAELYQVGTPHPEWLIRDALHMGLWMLVTHWEGDDKVKFRGR